MLRLLVVPFLATLLAPLASATAQSEDAARLIPANATILVRVQSSQALDDFVHAFAPLGGDAASFDLQSALNGRPSDAQTSGVLIDPGLPLYFAVTLDPAAGPGVTLVVPVTNGQPLQLFGGLGAPLTNVTLGKYTGASSIQGYGANSALNALVAALRPGLVSAHIDLQAILALYRPLIDMGLQQAESAMDTVASDDVPFDVQPMLEAYLGGVRSVLDAAEALDLGLERRGDELSFQLDFRAAVGSKLDGWMKGPSADLTHLAGLIDPASSIQLLCNRSWVEYMQPFEGFLDAALALYPEPFRSDMRTMIEAQEKLGPLLQPGFALGGDFTPQGMHGLYVLSSSQPAAFLAGIEATLGELDHPGGLFHLGPVERLTIDGLAARVHPLTIDYGSIQALISDLEPTETQAFAEFQRVLETVYGRTLRLALAARENCVMLCLANDDGTVKSDLARLCSPAAPSPNVQRLMDRIAPDSAGLAYHVDIGQTLGQVFEVMRTLLPARAMVFPKAGASFDFWGSIHERTWTGGCALSVQELLGFVQSLQSLAQD